MTPAQTTFEGQLVRDAELRVSRCLDHAGPSMSSYLHVVCLYLRPTDNTDRRSCYAEILFKPDERAQAAQCAQAHKKGQVVTVATDALDVRMTFPQAQIINSHTPTHAS